MTPEEKHMPPSTMARAKPFVVASISTKRYAPTTNRAPMQKLLRIPLRTSTNDQLIVPRGVPTNQTSRPGSLPTVVPKVELHHPQPKPMSMPATIKTVKVEKLLLLPLASSPDWPLPEKTFVPKPLKIVQRLREGKLMGGCPASVPMRSTQSTTLNELPPRPSCVPRTRMYRSSVSVTAASKGKQDVTIKVSTIGPRNLGVRPKTSVSIGTAKIAGGVEATEASVKKPAVTSGYRTEMPTMNRRPTPPDPIAHSHAIEPAFRIAWSPPGSPALSSFTSQSWAIVVGVDAKQIKAPTKICHDETLSGLGVAGTPKDSCERSEFVSSSRTLLSSPTVVETPASPAKSTVGSNGTVEINTPTKEPFAEVSHAVCAATIISPSGNGSASSMATLAKVMDRSQALLPAEPEVSDTGNRTRMMARRAFEIARTFFSPSRLTSQSRTETATSKTMGTNVSRIRKLLVPPLDKDAKASKNPKTQIEIEMLRARRKVGGGGVIDHRLDRLGSLAAMAIVAGIGTSSSDGPSQF